MSIRLSDKYPGKIAAPDANYQDGSIQNETVPDVSDDGTPLDFEWGNDFEGLKQRLILMSGITPSDSSDTSLGGDILDALFGETSPFKAQPTFPAAMQIRLSPGSTGGAVQAEQTSSAITAPSVNPRIDVIVVDAATGAIGIVAGSESASPVAPAISGDKRGIAQISLVVSQTSIVDSDITDIRQMIKGPSTSDITAENIVPASDADVTLTDAQYVKDRLVLVDGSWASGHSIIVPNESRLFYIDNGAGTYDALINTAAGTGITIAAGDAGILVCDGVNVLDPLTVPVTIADGSITDAKLDPNLAHAKMVLLEKKSVTASTLEDFTTNLSSSFSRYVLAFRLNSSTNGSEIRVRTSHNSVVYTGAGYRSTVSAALTYIIASPAFGGTGLGGSSSKNTTSGTVEFKNPNDAAFAKHVHVECGYPPTGTLTYPYTPGYEDELWAASAGDMSLYVIDGIQIYISAGTMNGEIELYGIEY